MQIWFITRVTRRMSSLKQESLHEEWQTIQWPNEPTTKRQAMIYKTLHKKQKIEQHSTTIFGELRFPGRVSRSCITCDTCCVTHKRHEHHLMWKSCWTPVYIKTNKIPAFLEVVLIKCGC